MKSTPLGNYMEVEDLGSTPSGKTNRFQIKSKSSGDPLGFVMWYGAWRQYTFSPERGTTFNANCLVDIEKFLNALNTRHRALSTA